MPVTTDLPAHFDPAKVGEVWRVPYQERAIAAQAWARQQHIQPATSDRQRFCLLAIDVQNTFCIPGYELFVGGRSGTGAVNDNIRLCEFIYRNLAEITEIALTMDTHRHPNLSSSLLGQCSKRTSLAHDHGDARRRRKWHMAS